MATTEGASHDASDTPTVARSNPYLGLPQELQNGVHECMMEDSVDGRGVVDIMDSSLWNYTAALKSLHDQDSFRAALDCQTLFLKRHNKFRAICSTAREIDVASDKYLKLTALLARPRSQDSFVFLVKSMDEDDTAMMDALVCFYIKAATQWTGAERHFGAMLLQSIDLFKVRFQYRAWPPWTMIVSDSYNRSDPLKCLHMERLQSLFDTHNVAADLVADPDFVTRFWRMIVEH